MVKLSQRQKALRQCMIKIIDGEIDFEQEIRRNKLHLCWYDGLHACFSRQEWTTISEECPKGIKVYYQDLSDYLRDIWPE